MRHATVLWVNARWFLERMLDVTREETRHRVANWLLDELAYVVVIKPRAWVSRRSSGKAAIPNMPPAIAPWKKAFARRSDERWSSKARAANEADINAPPLLPQLISRIAEQVAF